MGRGPGSNGMGRGPEIPEITVLIHKTLYYKCAINLLNDDEIPQLWGQVLRVDREQ